ncbi:MAG: hypothetical protein IJ154_03290 [Bacteroidales bacterium]|nr:hypothetical protein [Bacteroidales bacterium]
MTDDYSDIISLPHHRSLNHPPMPVENRAAQFAPFAALTGFGAAIHETARLTECRIELDEYGHDRLNRQMALLRELLPQQPVVTLLYFRPDSRKQGGTYVSASGHLKRIDDYGQRLVLTDGRTVDFDFLADIDIPAAASFCQDDGQGK